MHLKLDHSDNDLLRVRVSGKIGQGELNSESEPLQSLAGPGVYARKVLLNLVEASYVDSLGVGWLLRCHKRCREAGGKLVVHNVPPLTMQVLRVLQLERVLFLAPNEAAAETMAKGDAA
jgi:anti-sigma B factor antagonist